MALTRPAIALAIAATNVASQLLILTRLVWIEMVFAKIRLNILAQTGITLQVIAPVRPTTNVAFPEL